MRKAIDLVNVFIAVLAGGFLVVLTIWTDRAILLEESLVARAWMQLLLFVAGCVVVLWNLWVAVQGALEGRYRRNLQLTTEEGTNTLSIRAIEEQLLAELLTAGDVSRAKVCMDVRGEGVPLLCRLAFRLARQDDVMHRVDQLKKVVREAFFRMIPSGIGIEIAAEVTDLFGPEPAAPAAPADQPSEEFSGPKYPVSDSESEIL